MANSLLALLLLITEQAHAAAAPPLKIRYEVMSLSTEEILATVKGVHDDIQDARKGSNAKTMCKFVGGRFPCIRYEDGHVQFLPPLPSMVPLRHSDLTLANEYVRKLGSPIPRWREEGFLEPQLMPVAEVSHGTQVFASLSELAATATVFGCQGGECLRVYELWSPAMPDAHALGLCRTPVDTTDAPPSACAIVAAVLGGQVYVLALDKIVPTAGEGQPDFSFVIVAPLGTDLTPTLRRLSEALARAPWQLSIRRLKDGLLAHCGRRSSPFDNDYRETLTVRLDWEDGNFQQRDLGKLRFIEIVISTTIYTNRLNTTSPLDWHLPTPEQEQIYLRSLATTLRAAITAGCRAPSSRWLDSWTLSCGVTVPDNVRIKVPVMISPWE